MRLIVNGSAVDVEASPLGSLVHVLRDGLGLTGTGWIIYGAGMLGWIITGAIVGRR